MRYFRSIVLALMILSLGVHSHAHGADELGHHWDMPVYRSEMLTQILIMACISLAVFGSLLIAQAYRRRRSR